MVRVWMVTWMHCGERCLIDLDSENAALALAVALSETGRTDVHVTVVDYDDDPERAARIWARIQERIQSDIIPAVFQ